MGDYMQDILKVKQRARIITITNEFREIPTIDFIEEIVVFTDTEIISKTKTQLPINMREAMIDPTQTFNLYNPDTNEIIGTSTYGDIYLQLYGLYMSLATIRDIPVPVPEPVQADQGITPDAPAIDGSPEPPPAPPVEPAVIP